jgi:hypothetical protein
MNGSVNESNGTYNALETEKGSVTCSGRGKISFLNGNDSLSVNKFCPFDETCVDYLSVIGFGCVPSILLENASSHWPEGCD